MVTWLKIVVMSRLDTDPAGVAPSRIFVEAKHGLRRIGAPSDAALQADRFFCNAASAKLGDDLVLIES